MVPAPGCVMEDAVLQLLKDALGDLKSDVRNGFTSLEAKLEAKADKLDVAKLENSISLKADKADVIALAVTVDGLEKARAGELSASKFREQALATRRWTIATAAALGGSAFGYVIERIITGH